MALVPDEDAHIHPVCFMIDSPTVISVCGSLSIPLCMGWETTSNLGQTHQSRHVHLIVGILILIKNLIHFLFQLPSIIFNLLHYFRSFFTKCLPDVLVHNFKMFASRNGSVGIFGFPLTVVISPGLINSHFPCCVIRLLILMLGLPFLKHFWACFQPQNPMRPISRCCCLSVVVKPVLDALKRKWASAAGWQVFQQIIIYLM